MWFVQCTTYSAVKRESDKDRRIEAHSWRRCRAGRVSACRRHAACWSASPQGIGCDWPASEGCDPCCSSSTHSRLSHRDTVLVYYQWIDRFSSPALEEQPQCSPLGGIREDTLFIWAGHQYARLTTNAPSIFCCYMLPGTDRSVRF